MPKLSSKTALCNTPLPIFVGIIEFGKKRLSEILNFLQTQIKPHTYRIAYINIDSIVVAMAAPSLADIASLPHSTHFQDLFQSFFQSNCPGSMKLEWSTLDSDAWKFVSPHPRCYALVTNSLQQDKHKISSLKNLSSQYVYRAACAFLKNQPMSIHQIRRINKMANTKTKVQTIVFNAL